MAIGDGYRESMASWSGLLPDLKERGLQSGPLLTCVRRVGELSMENEILRRERELQARRPLTARRSST